ncbi:MAG: hypothetical protein JXA96_17190 [Sedimentisphaerales bacterium]|nr:hypothetical protein [Sedimentisphaerales bacterium]
MSDLEIYKELADKYLELAATYFKAKEYFEEMYRIVTLEAKGYWQCLEDNQDRYDALWASNAELRRLLGIARCPNCDGSGVIPHQAEEVEQCQWCYEVKKALK